MTSTGLVLNQEYCARVRARGERDTALQEVYGDFTYLDDGSGWAFQWTGYPAGGACTPSCNAGYLGADDYVLPARGTLTRLTPLITWKPLSGQPELLRARLEGRELQQHRRLRLHAGPGLFAAQLHQGRRRTPTRRRSSTGRSCRRPTSTAAAPWATRSRQPPSNFQKQSIPPAAISPANGALLTVQPVFRWTQVEGARRYRFQVAQEPTFAAPLEDVTTAATSYTPFTTHPADTTLYWRVRADDENLIGLNWSPVRTFQRRLPTPTPSAGNTTSGDFTPSWKWSNVTGASGYTFAMDGPDGEHQEWANMRMPATAFVYLFGPGIWRWRVRAEFPKTSGFVTGPWSSYVPFTRTLGEPSGATTSVSGNHVLLSWNWKLGAKDFDVQISQRPDFATTIEDVTTDNTSYAPLLHTLLLRQRRLVLLARGRPGQELQRRRLVAAAADRHLSATARGRQSEPLLAAAGLASSSPCRIRSGKAVARASVRVTGAGMRPKSGRTNGRGKVTLRVRPKKRGRLLFRATKQGFAAGSLSMRIR